MKFQVDVCYFYFLIFYVRRLSPSVYFTSYLELFLFLCIIRHLNGRNSKTIVSFLFIFEYINNWITSRMFRNARCIDAVCKQIIFLDSLLSVYCMVRFVWVHSFRSLFYFFFLLWRETSLSPMNTHSHLYFEIDFTPANICQIIFPQVT